MIEEIKNNLSNPETLEKLYRSDKKAFRAEFSSLYTEEEGNEAVKFWKARLDYNTKPEILKAITLADLIPVIISGLIVVLLIKIPALFPFGFDEEVFYMKNAAIIVLSGLTLYTLWTKGIRDQGKLIFTSLAFLIPLIYINLLPWKVQTSDQVDLVYLHLPLLMWFIYGIVFTGFDYKNAGKRMGFIRYMGDMAIVYALIAIAGGLLTAITIGLFDSIGLRIEDFYMKNIVLSGAAAAPILATYLIEKFPAMVSKTASIIALIFSPLVLLTLIIFLGTIVATGKDPYNDRDFLLIFNVMLLGVMGIIIFSVSETSLTKSQKFSAIILFALSIVTIVIDLVALSAIFYRLGEYGLTPNRLAVLVTNLLVLANLALLMADLFKINFRRSDFSKVEQRVAGFLPVYLAWIIVVVFGFPLIFGLN